MGFKLGELYVELKLDTTQYDAEVARVKNQPGTVSGGGIPGVVQSTPAASGVSQGVVAGGIQGITSPSGLRQVPFMVTPSGLKQVPFEDPNLPIPTPKGPPSPFKEFNTEMMQATHQIHRMAQGFGVLSVAMIGWHIGSWINQKLGISKAFESSQTPQDTTQPTMGGALAQYEVNRTIGKERGEINRLMAESDPGNYRRYLQNLDELQKRRDERERVRALHTTAPWKGGSFDPIGALFDASEIKDLDKQIEGLKKSTVPKAIEELSKMLTSLSEAKVPIGLSTAEQAWNQMQISANSEQSQYLQEIRDRLEELIRITIDGRVASSQPG